MSYIYEVAYFAQKNVCKWARHEFVTWSLSGKKNSSLSGNILTLYSVKKVMKIVFWDMTGPITFDFLEKGATINSTSVAKS